MRFALHVVALAVLFSAGCAPPPTVVPGAAPMPVGVDAELPFYVAGVRTAFFVDTLRLELDRRNLRLVSADAAPVVAFVELGHANFHSVIDVYLSRDGTRSCAGRLRLGDRSMTTLDVAADVVAEIIAQSIVSSGPRPASCDG